MIIQWFQILLEVCRYIWYHSTLILYMMSVWYEAISSMILLSLPANPFCKKGFAYSDIMTLMQVLCARIVLMWQWHRSGSKAGSLLKKYCDADAFAQQSKIILGKELVGLQKESQVYLLLDIDGEEQCQEVVSVSRSKTQLQELKYFHHLISIQKCNWQNHFRLKSLKTTRHVLNCQAVHIAHHMLNTISLILVTGRGCLSSTIFTSEFWIRKLFFLTYLLNFHIPPIFRQVIIIAKTLLDKLPMPKVLLQTPQWKRRRA